MANQEHLTILLQGNKVWNSWVRENLAIIPDLSGADLSTANLSKTDLSGANLSESNLNTTSLSEADLSASNLNEANLSGADLRQANLFGANLRRANLFSADLRQANLFGANLFGANLFGADLSEAILTGANLFGADLSGANLSEADLSEAELTGANLSEAKLTGLKLYKQERRFYSSSTHLIPEEFTELFSRRLETVELIFFDGIDWQAFLAAFHSLQMEFGSDKLMVQAIERKSGGALVIRIEIPSHINKSKVEMYIKQEYEIQLEIVTEKYKLQFQVEDREIAKHRRQNANLLELVKLAASQPITYPLSLK